ncbi:hypothetical protein FB45DRAFT_1034456 [Roridomyces roridus]|uniref:Uncharacterized protein n=1 Tax=Roridomyces roridus TaxID=1738132 RepID=A0AAD7BD23_9AGAR|nr:hypothetical protein FB45DRAFT_1034456 [Roridomyces roridus]
MASAALRRVPGQACLGRAHDPIHSRPPSIRRLDVHRAILYLRLHPYQSPRRDEPSEHHRALPVCRALTLLPLLEPLLSRGPLRSDVHVHVQYALSLVPPDLDHPPHPLEAFYASRTHPQYRLHYRLRINTNSTPSYRSSHPMTARSSASEIRLVQREVRGLSFAPSLQVRAGGAGAPAVVLERGSSGGDSGVVLDSELDFELRVERASRSSQGTVARVRTAMSTMFVSSARSSPGPLGSGVDGVENGVDTERERERD